MNKRILLLVTSVILLVPQYPFAMEQGIRTNQTSPNLVCFNHYEPATQGKAAEDKSTTPKITLSCNHTFCTECLNQIIDNAIDNTEVPVCSHRDHIRQRRPYTFSISELNLITNNDTFKIKRIETIKTQKQEALRKQKAELEAEANSGNSSKQEAINPKCEACLGTHTPQECITLQCKHICGKACLNKILIDCVGKSEMPRCPHADCRKKDDSSIHPADYSKITTDHTILCKLERVQLKKAIGNSPNIKECPTNNCPFVFLIDPKIREHETCPMCVRKYCTHCLLDHANTVDCNFAKTSTNKSAADKASEDEIARITKPCPGCHAKIQKNDGCLHMTCKAPGCGYEWCWNCLGQWRGHGDYYHCQRTPIITGANPFGSLNTRQNPTRPMYNYDHDENRLNERDQRLLENAQEYLERYNFFGRYENLNRRQRTLLDARLNNIRLPQTPEYARERAQRTIEELNKIESNFNFNPPFNPALLLLAVPPVLVAIRLITLIKSPIKIKAAIEHLQNLIDDAPLKKTDNLLDYLNKNQYALTISSQKIAQLREYVINEQFREFMALATECKKELEAMTAPNAGFTNAFKKIRWGISADLYSARQGILKTFGRA